MRYFIFGRLKSWYLIVDTSTLSHIWRLSPYILSLKTIPECTVISFGKRLIVMYWIINKQGCLGLKAYPSGVAIEKSFLHDGGGEVMVIKVIW
jgi:hypothetical protein